VRVRRASSIESKTFIFLLIADSFFLHIYFC
jgi:hypothetical protein